MLKMLTCLLRQDFVILADAPNRLFDFERRDYGPNGCEYFGLGLHLIFVPHRGSTRSTK